MEKTIDGGPLPLIGSPSFSKIVTWVSSRGSAASTPGADSTFSSVPGGSGWIRPPKSPSTGCLALTLTSTPFDTCLNRSSNEALMVSVKMNVPATNATPITTAKPVRTVRSLRANSPRRAIRVIYATCFIRSSSASADSADAVVHDAAVAQHDDAVGGGRRARVVRDHDDRLAELVDCAAQHVEHVGGRLGVEVAGRLVGEHHGRTRDQRAGDRDALLLAARQLGGPVRQAVAQADGVDHRVEPLVVDGGAGERQRERDVLPRGQHRDEVVRLEDEAELVAPQRREPLVVEVRELLAGDDDRARRRAVESGEQVHQRGLAGPGGPHDRGELAGRELEA